MNSGTLALRFGPVTPAAAIPLYEQIVAAVRREVDAKRLATGEALPSVRALAAELGVSVITVTRAYEELERIGILQSRQGLGTFIAGSATGYLRRLNRETALTAMRTAITAGREGGLSNKTVAVLSDLLATETSKGKEQ